MLDELEYITETGSNDAHKITVYALSTCGFCRRGLNFLRSNSITFRYIYVDQLPYEVKQQAKTELKATFDKRVVFPFVVVDETNAMLGFVEKEWRNTLGID